MASLSGSQGGAAAIGAVGEHAGAAGVAVSAGSPIVGTAPPAPSTAQGPGVGIGAGMRKGSGAKMPPGSGGGSSTSMSSSLSSSSLSKPKGLAGDGKGAVIRMRGLPYRASKSEVMGFFKGCSIPEEGIAFVTRADGRVTGEAYVRFATREDAKMGIRKDREMMVSFEMIFFRLVD